MRMDGCRFIYKYLWWLENLSRKKWKNDKYSSRLKCSICNKILQILIYFIIHFQPYLKIARIDIKFWGNRVETCHCPGTKLIGRYLMTEVSVFSFTINHPVLGKMDAMVSAIIQIEAHQVVTPLQSQW